MTVLYLFELFIIYMVSTHLNCSNVFIGVTIRYIHLPYVCWQLTYNHQTAQSVKENCQT